MAKRLIFGFINVGHLKNINEKNVTPFLGTASVFKRKLHTENVPVKEFQIPVEWGHVAAKLWGNEHSRPVLALHGWQDNAGTWDTLAPMIYKNQPVLAIDLPGHGMSSWYPPGMHYYSWEFPRFILFLKQYFGWDKISLLCHSMGSIAGCRFASLFSDDVDYYVAIDSIIYDDYDLNFVIDKYPILLQKLQITQKRLNDEPPSYTFEDLKMKWHLGTRKSVSLESTEYLIKRGTKQSTTEPNKYYFSRDSRLKHTLFNPENKKFVEALVKRLKCPTLYIKGIDSPYGTDGFSVEMREIIENNNDKFQCVFLPGTHHLHLNNPELVAPVVVQFLKKHNLWKLDQNNA